MPTYGETLSFLYNLQLFGIKKGLSNIRSLLRNLGNPEDHFRSIHIAGTNGKGSTASMIAAALTASGYRTGLYTSPHLIDFSERIRIDGKKINEADLVHYAKLLRPVLIKSGATFFEATTAIAFRYFSDRNVDVAVVETGLGGRWDATNVLSPMLSIITNVTIEHKEHLGSTYRRIASEKGGIIKPFTPCVTGAANGDALGELKKIAAANRSPLIIADRISSVRIKENSLNGLKVDLVLKGRVHKDLTTSLPGIHQACNLQLAFIALEYIRLCEGFQKIVRSSVIRGFSEVKSMSGIRGRLDVMMKSPLVISDVAHNPDSTLKLVGALKLLIPGKFVLLFGVMKDKEYGIMIRSLSQLARMVVAVSPDTERALGCSEIIAKFNEFSILAINGGKVANGVGIALNEVRSGETVVVTGSHYVAGEAFKFLKRRFNT